MTIASTAPTIESQSPPVPATGLVRYERTLQPPLAVKRFSMSAAGI